jgi:hypothetical protein
MAHIPSMIDYLLKGQSEEFMIWAFGKVYNEMAYITFVNEWNKRHSDEYRLCKYGRPEDELHVMIKLWRKK